MTLPDYIKKTILFMIKNKNCNTVLCQYCPFDYRGNLCPAQRAFLNDKQLNYLTQYYIDKYGKEDLMENLL